MIVRLGYVSISKTIESYVKQSSITYTNYLKDNEKMDFVIRHNLESLIEIIKYNIKNNVHFYRISSNIIPLVTKREVEFDYLSKYSGYYNNISKLLNDSNMRIDMHASNFLVLNSVKKEVVENSIDELKYYYNILNKFDINSKLVILHIGSSVLGKKNAISRFINNFRELPDFLKGMIAIENDDKVFFFFFCIYVSKMLNIPIVLDYHHFNCNGDGDITKYLNDIIDSWRGFIPKMHFSSPLSKKEFRSHSEYIDVDKFIEFINILSNYDRDIDIMLEAKGKDMALFKLVRELKYKSNYTFIDDSSFIVKI